MKYIDVEKLKAEIKGLQCEQGFEDGETERGYQVAIKDILRVIDSLQQDETQLDKMLCSQVWWEEQGWVMIPPNVTIDGIDFLLKQVRKKLQQEQPDLPGIEESGIPGKDYIPVDWVDACENYGKWKIVKQEQPEVDLEKELIRYQREDMDRDTTVGDVARHFYELGLNARKED